MKTPIHSSSVWLLVVILLLTGYGSYAQSASGWNRKQAVKWYNTHKWLNGLPLKPHPSTDQQEFARQYHNNKAGWDRAFAYLKETDLNSLTPGRHQIDGDNVFAMVTEGPAKDLSQTKWEAHRHYNDIHYVVKGKEKIGVTPVAGASLTEAYDPERDIMFYSAEGKFHLAEPGTFFIFSPKEAHRPGVKVAGEESPVKKIVIKVKTTL
jgi:YhcH/YjgK/YiaL family protein